MEQTKESEGPHTPITTITMDINVLEMSEKEKKMSEVT
jgi:hypothetical protein